MTVRRLFGRGAAVAGAVALATGTMVFAVGASAGASSVEKSFEEEGAHEWTVPANVCSVWVEAFGAQGGDAIDTGASGDDAGGGTNPGGLGGAAKAWIAVTPGETLWINVGEQGGDAVDGIPGEGGDNGGGDGGLSVNEDDEAGAGGGGASDVRQGGSDWGDRVVVAGGGGGAGGGIEDDPPAPGGAGGDGGGEEGDDGQPSAGAPTTQGGEGASESEGGDGGVTTDPAEAGDDGELGEGGEGGSADGFAGEGGGGGGGGLYGGGGGAASQSDGEFVDGAGGGGGSGYGPDDTDFENGEQEDDGEVTISYDPVADACATAIVVEPKFTG